VFVGLLAGTAVGTALFLGAENPVWIGVGAGVGAGIGLTLSQTRS